MSFGCDSSEKPCVSVDIINNGAALPVNRFTLVASPKYNEAGDATLSFVGDDIEYFDCCTMIRVVVSWPYYNLFNYHLYDGIFNGEVSNKILAPNFTSDNDREIKINEIIYVLKNYLIAYPSGDPGALKSGPSIKVAYDYIIENVGSTTVRGETGSVFSNTPLPITVIPPNASQISLSPLWEGDKEFSNLFDTVIEISKFGNFTIKASVDDATNGIKIEFVDSNDDLTTNKILAQCLGNSNIVSVSSECEHYDIAFSVGSISGIQTVAEWSDPNVSRKLCSKETIIESKKDETTLLQLQTSSKSFILNQPPRKKYIIKTDWNCELVPIVDVNVGSMIKSYFDGIPYNVRVSSTPFMVVDNNLTEFECVVEIE